MSFRSLIINDKLSITVLKTVSYNSICGRMACRKRRAIFFDIEFVVPNGIEVLGK